MTGRRSDSVFSRGKGMDETVIVEMKKIVEKALPSYSHDQYIHYPSKKNGGWVTNALTRLEQAMADPEYLFFYEAPSLLACRVSRWDEEHFGFGIAMVSLFISQEGDGSTEGTLLDECITMLRERGVKFVSARIAGDDVATIHAFEERGFRYYETIIRPVLMLDGKEIQPDSDVRLMENTDLERVCEIVGNHQFKRSHYHLDGGFDSINVDKMHAKWAKTSWQNREPAAVIEVGGKVAGYFAFRMDKKLSEALGLRYASMRSLTLDPVYRGKGIGKRIFTGAIAMMREMGADVIDSSYPSKNHQSARLHMQHGFESRYDEITVHLWLEGIK
jgi:L-amino acid N-acyltransferase YncA